MALDKILPIKISMRIGLAMISISFSIWISHCISFCAAGSSILTQKFWNTGIDF